MNKKIVFGLVGVAILGLTACGNSSSQATTTNPTTNPTTSEYKPDLSQSTTVRMSVNYGATGTGMKYDGDSKVSLPYTAPDGTTYSSGDFKPVYKHLQEALNFSISDVTVSGSKAVDAFKNDWATAAYKGVDLLCGNVSDIVNKSVAADSFVNLLDYAEYLPNLMGFLDANPVIKASVTTQAYGEANKNAIYYSPYFDGNDDLEKMTLLRTDYVKKLLDENNADADYDTAATVSTKYSKTVANGTYEITVPVSLTSNDTKVITKNITNNIIDIQNALPVKDGKSLTQALRTYIKATYGDQYANPSDLFIGVDAAYDADEMVALMRCVKASPKLLTGDANTAMFPFIPRQHNNQRIADLFRWGGQMWGVRGVESRSEYLYFGTDGKLHDARGDQAAVDLLENLNELYQEGLILSDFENASSNGASSGAFNNKFIAGNGGGFMEYDYSQTQGVLNDNAASKLVEGYDFSPVLPAVANWKGDNKYFHFTESWRSVKTQAWALTTDSKSDNVRFMRALAIMDYFYSEEGHNLNSYGPEAEGYTNGTINYLGRKVPKFTQAALDQCKNLASGSYTDYLRYFVGATLPVGYIKEQGMEYQMTHAKAMAGLDKINKGIELGTLKHVTASIENEDPFFKIVPSSFRISSGDATTLTNLSVNISTINTNGSTSNYSLWNKYVMYGFGGTYGSETLQSKEGYLTMVNTTWDLTRFVKIYQDSYDLMGLE